MGPDGSCVRVPTTTSRCLLRGVELPSDQSWCLSHRSVTDSGVNATAKWVGNMGPEQRDQLMAEEGWCNERNWFNNHTYDEQFFANMGSGTVRRSAECLCCGPPRKRCFDSKLRLSRAAPNFLPPSELLSLRSLVMPASSEHKAIALASLRQQNDARLTRRTNLRICTFVGSAPDGMNGAKKFSLRRDAIADTWADENTFVIWPRELPYVQNRTKRLTPFFVDIPANLKYSEVTHRYFRLLEMLHPDEGAASVSDCAFSLVVDDDAYINVPAWKDYFSSGWLNPDDCWYMGPFSSVRIDRGMMPFAHGTTMVFSRGLVREARSWLPLCYTYFDNAEGNVDYWGDVAIGKCFNLFSVYALRPSKRLVMMNQGGATEDAMKTHIRERQCILSVHKLDETTIFDVHFIIEESRASFPAHACGQDRPAWLGSPGLKACDIPVFAKTSLTHDILDYCTARVLDGWSLVSAVVAAHLTASAFPAALAVPNMESASLCAEACLALGSPTLCYAYTWNEHGRSCGFVDHITFRASGLPVDPSLWGTQPLSPFHDNNVDGAWKSNFVSGVCRFSTAVPLPHATAALAW
jgi:hypothetical protein